MGRLTSPLPGSASPIILLLLSILGASVHRGQTLAAQAGTHLSPASILREIRWKYAYQLQSCCLFLFSYPLTTTVFPTFMTIEIPLRVKVTYFFFQIVGNIWSNNTTGKRSLSKYVVYSP